MGNIAQFRQFAAFTKKNTHRKHAAETSTRALTISPNRKKTFLADSSVTPLFFTLVLVKLT